MLMDMLIRIALVGILGGLIGLERQMRAKEIGRAAGRERV